MTPLKIFSDPRLSPEILEVLRNGIAPHELMLPAKIAASVLEKSEADPAFAEADIAFGQPDLRSIYDSEKLKWIHTSTAGYTRYDTPEFREHVKKRGLIFTTSSGVYAEACAQHVFAFMLANSRQLPKSLVTRIPNGVPEWMALRASYSLLQGQSVLILGYGGIAERLVRMLAPFEMEITAVRRRPRGDEGVKVIGLEQVSEVLGTADHVINILPDNAESVGYFNDERFSAMKPGAVFYNIGRGTTVDQEALFRILSSGHLEAAWLDVTEPEPLPDDHPLWTLPNCHITPHTAGGHRNESLTMVRHFLGNFRRYVNGEALVDRMM